MAPESGPEDPGDVAATASPHLTAVVCHNGLLALGAVRGAKQTGLSVPDDISVVAVDDIFTASYVDPPLTTLALPRVEAGSMALQWLQAQAESLSSPQVIHRLVVRGSTGAVRRKGVRPTEA